MQSITIRYLPPTNHRGPRYKAICNAGSVTIEQYCNLDPHENAIEAVAELVRKLGWDHRTRWAIGGNRDEWHAVPVTDDNTFDVASE